MDYPFADYLFEDHRLVDQLNERAKMLAVIRRFFETKNVLEVNTPGLGRHTVSDPHIQSIPVTQDSRTYFLQTSPEFAMKRLLARGSGPIYQICQAFRGGESGSLHNTEFTMLEWYRPGLNLDQLMDELADLLRHLCEEFDIILDPFETSAYKTLFERRFAINPHRASIERLLEIADDQLADVMAHISRSEEGAIDDIRDVMFATCIEIGSPHFVTGFPASQAALAKVGKITGDDVALRFELYWQGIEIANGYDELTDPDELELRIRRDNKIRKGRNLPTVEPDQRLLTAMRQMGACTGVAVGLDRLLMLLTGKSTLQEVMSFTTDNG